MKKIFALLLPLFFVVSLSAQDTTAYPPIKKVIEGETLAFANADLATWSSYFVHEPYVRWSVSPAMFFDGWQALYDGAKAFLDSQKGRSDANQLHTITRSDWNIHVNGNVALVKFIQSTEGTVGSSQQFRVLEKTGDDWKISMLVAVQ
jgi:hypothetical protein